MARSFGKELRDARVSSPAHGVKLLLKERGHVVLPIVERRTRKALELSPRHPATTSCLQLQRDNGYEYYRRLRVDRVELFEEFKSVQLRHDQIGNHEIHPLGVDYFECFGSVAGFLKLITLPPQHLANQYLLRGSSLTTRMVAISLGE
jgi:hypothetical protein